MGAESHARMLEADEANLTWAGRRLLKPWYLDELPQLWNVIRGDMSLVGPRPWPPSMVATQMATGLTYRNEFIAGWTGPAQVQKGVTEPAGYAELDVSYVDTCRHSTATRHHASGRPDPLANPDRDGEGGRTGVLARHALWAIQMSSLGQRCAHSGDTTP